MGLFFTLIVTSYSYQTVSTPLSYYTLANPAFTSHLGNYEVYLEPKDIGEITVFNVSGRFRSWGFGLSNYYEQLHADYERKNWVSIACHLKHPLSVGCNLGLSKILDETAAFVDIGAWFRANPGAGFGYFNSPNETHSIRFGASYVWKKFTGILEIEDSLLYDDLVAHFLVSFDQPINDFDLKVSAGYHPKHLVFGMEMGFRDFIKAIVSLEETRKVLVGFNFSPPVVTKEITVVETLMVEKPIIVKTTKTYPMNMKDIKYCEEHYRKGIEYYVNNRIEDAIKEWNLAVKVCPDYKEVQQYLGRAKAKLEMLKQ